MRIYITKIEPMSLKYIEKKQKFHVIGLHRYLRDTKETLSK